MHNKFGVHKYLIIVTRKIKKCIAKILQPYSFSWYQHVHMCLFFYRNQMPLMSPADFNIHLILSSQETLFMNMVKWKIKHIGNDRYVIFQEWQSVTVQASVICRLCIFGLCCVVNKCKHSLLFLKVQCVKKLSIY